MRLIPAAMSTQHPDNASSAYWCGKSFLSTTDEIEEAYRAFRELGCDEYMWDWEGKFVDEAVIDKLLRRYQTYFKKTPLGKKKFLTYRIPNIWEERGYRLARAFINILTSSDLARELKFHAPPVFEVILPMTKNSRQILETEALFKKVARLKCEVFSPGEKCDFDRIEVIPLVERVEDLTKIDAILEPFIEASRPAYVRPFIARSDPALNSGLIPAVISSKAAISLLEELSQRRGLPVYPIIGTGSLPFRGSMNPENIREAIKEYSGIRTVTVQSAFKYDYPLPMVQKALAFIRKSLPRLRPEILSKKEIRDIRLLNAMFSKPYRETVEPLAPFINRLATHIPSRRERMLHIGLFGYSRGMGKIRLPRAIAFTGALYSLGVPPEFIGTGRGLFEVKKRGMLDSVKRLYVNLERDLTHAGKYLNKENLALLARKIPAFQDIAEDIRQTEEILGLAFGPFKDHHFLHRNTVSTVYYKMHMREDFSADIEAAARMRKSLG